MTPRGAKIGPRAAKKHQERLELEFLASFFHSGGFLIDFWPRLGRPEVAKRQPKRPQECPREAQDRQKEIRDAPRRARSAAQEAFKPDIEKTIVF